jgi:hypothetical protein
MIKNKKPTSSGSNASLTQTAATCKGTTMSGQLFDSDDLSTALSTLALISSNITFARFGDKLKSALNSVWVLSLRVVLSVLTFRRTTDFHQTILLTYGSEAASLDLGKQSLKSAVERISETIQDLAAWYDDKLRDEKERHAKELQDEKERHAKELGDKKEHHQVVFN